MKNFLKKLTIMTMALSSFGAFAGPISESTEYVEISVNAENLKCAFVEQYAHAGSISFPEATYTNSEVTGTMFEHPKMTGQGYLPREFSCVMKVFLVARKRRMKFYRCSF